MPLLESIARKRRSQLPGLGSRGRSNPWRLALPARRAVLENALGFLPEKKRLVVALRHYEGLTLSETAQAMGTDTGTVRSLLDDAVARLARALLKADEAEARKSGTLRKRAA